MGAITREIREKYGRITTWIPGPVLDRIGEDEILDRLDEAGDYLRKSDTAPADLARGYMDLARIICEAQPRDETEHEAQKWTEKAGQAHTPQHAASCLTMAHDIRAANPPSPRRVRHLPAAEELRKAEAVKALQADIVKAANAERARQAEEDRRYQEALAGRRQWTIGDQVRYQGEQRA